MQTTLLGIGVAIILALAAALVGPLLIDWGGYRAIFETEASHLIGSEVRVTGKIDARLLPSPRLTLNDIEIGEGDGKIRARSLGIEFALAPLMRAEWRATELHLAGPQINLGVDAAGHVRAPTIAVAFDPDSLTIERLGIEDGKIIFTDAASGASTTLDNLWFNGDARSLIGPLKGEGAVKIGGELYPFRLTSGRYNDEAGIKLHVNVDPVSRPLSIEVDGALTLAGGEPKFDGSWKLRKPVGIDSHAGARLTQPWHLSGKLKANAKSALMEEVEFRYGSDEQGLKLTGVADFKFGKNPRFDGVLSGRQVDLDRVLVAADGSHPPPSAAIRELAELGGGAFRPTIPISIGIGVDQVTLGGSTVQNLRGDISSDAGGWNLDRFEFRAPGYTQVRLSGHLAVNADGVAFTGPAEIDANDPKVLTAWLEGRAGAAPASAGPSSAPTDISPLSLRGDVTLGSEKIAVERLTASFDRKTISGQMVYVFAAGSRQAKLDASLNAPDLDLDAALGFGKALLAGSKVERPRDMMIAADIGRATVGGFVARDASVRLKVDAAGLQIDKLAVADLGGAAFSASGRIVTTAPSPQGSINVDLNAPDMAPVVALVARFAPATAQALSRNTVAMAPAKLHAQLIIDGATPAIAKVGVDGSLGKVRIALNAQSHVQASADWFPGTGNVQLDGKLEADDGGTLLAMLGIDRALRADAGPGAMTLNVSGPAGGALRVDARLSAKGLEANASGTARPFAASPSASLRTSIVRANAAPLRGPNAGAAALPVTFEGRAVLAGDELNVTGISAKIGGTGLRGQVGMTLSTPHRLAGEIDADHIDGAALVAAAIGMPSTAPSSDKTWDWSTEPFADGAFGNLAGTIALKARRLDLSPRLTAREFRSTLRFGDREITIDDVTGIVAGGRLEGGMSYKDADSGLTARANLSLAGADASVLLASGARPPVTGSLDLSAEVEGTGLSPVGLIGSLQGKGKIAIAGAQFAGLDPRAFDTVTGAVDQGLTIDNAGIAKVVQRALESGQLSVKRADGSFTIGAGQIRLSNVTVDSKDAELSFTGNIDLTEGSLDARMLLSGANAAAGGRPDIFMGLTGPLAAPTRNIDVSALTGWLTLRAVEHQAKRLREAEAQRRGEIEAEKRRREVEAERRRRIEAERQRRALEAERRQQEIEAAKQQQVLEALQRRQALEAARSQPVPPPSAPQNKPTPGPLSVTPPVLSRPQAPALPAPVDIKPLPAPAGAGQPAGSVGSQN